MFGYFFKKSFRKNSQSDLFVEKKKVNFKPVSLFLSIKIFTIPKVSHENKETRSVFWIHLRERKKKLFSL